MLKSTSTSRTGKAMIAAMLAATAVGGFAATPAAAEPWRGHRHHGGGDAGAAIAGGIIGLAVGAAIASDRPREVVYRERYYEEPEYYPAPVYYEGPPAYYYERRPYPYYRAPRAYYYGYPAYRHGWHRYRY